MKMTLDAFKDVGAVVLCVVVIYLLHRTELLIKLLETRLLLEKKWRDAVKEEELELARLDQIARDIARRR